MKTNESGDIANVLFAPFLAVVISLLRTEYSARKRSWKKRILEGILLGFATKAAIPFLMFFGSRLFGLTQENAMDVAIFTAVTFGLIGVDALSEHLHKYFENSLK